MNFFLKLTLSALFIYACFLLASFAWKTKQNAHKFARANKILFSVLVVAITLFACYSAFFRNVSFANPRVLWLLIPLALCAAAFPWFQKFRPTVNFNLAYAKTTPTVKSYLATYLPGALTLLSAMLLTAALARPRDIDRAVLPPVEGVDIMLTLDTSRSMTNTDFMPNRLEAAKTAASDFVSMRSTDRIGMVVFDAIAMLVSPLTLDYDSLLDFTSEIQANMLRHDGTAIGDALAVSVAHLKDAAAKEKVIILLTDGANNSGSVTPALAAESAKTFGIKVYTIGTLGHDSKEDFDEAALREIAAQTGGKYFRAYDPGGLKKIYSEINNLEKTKFEPSVTVSYRDRYKEPLYAALAFLLLGLLLSKFVFVRIP